MSQYYLQLVFNFYSSHSALGKLPENFLIIFLEEIQ